MIPVFVVNLDMATQRLSNMTERLSALNIKWERILAISGTTISSETLKSLNKRARDRKISFMEMGCLHSHMQVWSKIVDENIPAALILEDDVKIAPSLPSLIEDVSWLPGDDCVIRLETFLRYNLLGPKLKDVQGYALYPLHSIQHGAAAYIITRKRAKALLEAYDQYVDTTDHLLYRYPQENNAYQMSPGVCVQEDIYHNGRLGATSTLEEQRYLSQLRSLCEPITLTKHLIWRVRSTLNIIVSRAKGDQWQIIPFKE